jgi:RNase P subunit RPR2
MKSKLDPCKKCQGTNIELYVTQAVSIAHQKTIVRCDRCGFSQCLEFEDYGSGWTESEKTARKRALGVWNSEPKGEVQR